MAIIKMDISEYEALKEIQNNLKDSLNREKELQDKVRKLQEERILDLESSQKQVIVYNKSVVTEHTNEISTAFQEQKVLDKIVNVLRDNLSSAVTKLTNIKYILLKKSYKTYEETSNHKFIGLEDVESMIRDELNKEYEKRIINYDKLSQIIKEKNDIIKKKDLEISENDKTIESLNTENIKLEGGLKKYETEITELHNSLINKDLKYKQLLDISYNLIKTFNSASNLGIFKRLKYYKTIINSFTGKINYYDYLQ